MLHTLFNLTKNLNSFHEVCRRTIISLEVPLLKGILLGFGADEVIHRHSILSKRYFNVFMSDIDLSVRASEKNFRLLNEVSLVIKKILPNLGEIEFYTDEEWKEITELTQAPYEKTWERLLLLRKLSWQKKALKVSRSQYDTAKQERGIAITLERLALEMPEGFYLDTVFPEFSDRKASGPAPVKSEFLEHPMFFRDEATASYFWRILPESPEHPESEEDKRLKSHLIRREILLTVVSKRNQMLRGNLHDLEAKNDWLTTLHKRVLELRGK